MRRPRLWTTARWAGLAAGAVLTAAWAASGRWTVYWSAGPRGAGGVGGPPGTLVFIAEGQAGVLTAQAGWSGGPARGWGMTAPRPWGVRMAFIGVSPPSRGVMLPIWPLAAAAWLTAGAAWTIERRSVRDALTRACPSCGYDLGGLCSSAACPECGGPPV